jgi:8-oxo-dGTP diphosphatase
METDKPEIGVGAIILDDSKEKILLILRKKNPEANTWSIPGGKLELYEALEQAAIRETKEEVNLDIAIDQLFCTSETMNEETQQHWISVIYTTKIIGGELKICEPNAISDMRWFSLNNLPEPIASFTRQALDMLTKNL